MSYLNKKLYIYIGLGVVTIVVGGFLIFVRDGKIGAVPTPTISFSVLAKPLSDEPTQDPWKDLLPLPPNVKWSQAVEKDYENYGDNSITLHGHQINAVGDIDLFSYYLNLDLEKLGWNQDFGADGPLGGILGFEKKNKHIILEFHIEYLGKNNGVEKPSCPCKYTNSIFVEN